MNGTDFRVQGTGLDLRTHYKRESRIGYLGFSYAFGDAKPKAPQRRTGGSIG